MDENTLKHEKIVITVSVVTIIINAVLSVAKLLAGIFADSGAMISDAVHSASDVFSTVIVLVGVKMASKASDKQHPYGHERMECVAAIVLAVVLAGTGAMLGYVGIRNIATGAYEGSVPGLPALITAVVSIFVKEGMYWYTRAAAKKTKSDALMADAWHHRSDALSSVGAFAGILGSILGVTVLDSVASIVICLLILKVAVDVFRGAVDKMVDRACDDKTVRDMTEAILSTDGVKTLDVIKTRIFGNRIYVEIEISVDGDLKLSDSHAIAEQVHNRIEAGFPDVKHCMVHVNPYLHICADISADGEGGGSETQR